MNNSKFNEFVNYKSDRLIDTYNWYQDAHRLLNALERGKRLKIKITSRKQTDNIKAKQENDKQTNHITQNTLQKTLN